MTVHNSNNERVKRQYFTYLKEAGRHSEATVDVVAAALHRFEAFNKFRDFRSFHHQQAIAFKNYLAEQQAQRSGETLSKATLHSTLAALKKFFFWLAGQPGFKSKFTYSDAEYFNISARDRRIATATREQPNPTLEQVKYVLSVMPAITEIERRDRALIAFTLLTGARDRAIASMRLKHVDLTEDCVYQDAREVSTKFRKTFTTHFFPVGDEIRAMVADWINYLRTEKMWGNDDPLFPSTRVAVGLSRHFEAAGLDRKHWRTATPIREIFRKAYERAGLPYFIPHSIRATLVQLGEALCRTPEEFKAWSQALGHDKVLTTFNSYGTVAVARQRELIRNLGKPRAVTAFDEEAVADAVVRKLGQRNTSA
jgi:site-specific recombinase XerD